MVARRMIGPQDWFQCRKLTPAVRDLSSGFKARDGVSSHSHDYHPMGNSRLDRAKPCPNTPLDNLGKRMATTKAELLQGTLDLLVLKTLATGPRHGYAIAQRIQECSADVLVVEEGSLYPALYRMEERGWIDASWGKSENNRRAKFYSLTRAGRKQLEEETALWERLVRAITLV